MTCLELRFMLFHKRKEIKISYLTSTQLRLYNETISNLKRSHLEKVSVHVLRFFYSHNPPRKGTTFIGP